MAALAGYASGQHPAASQRTVFQQDHRETESHLPPGVSEQSRPCTSEAPAAQAFPTLSPVACNTADYAATQGPQASAASPMLASPEPVTETASPGHTASNELGSSQSRTTSDVTSPATGPSSGVLSPLSPEGSHHGAGVKSPGARAGPATSEVVSSLSKEASRSKDNTSRRRRRKRVGPKS
ncbi:hypothetical protein MTO96_002696 [Rhipicephalus appendiculatus]